MYTFTRSKNGNSWFWPALLLAILIIEIIR